MLQTVSVPFGYNLLNGELVEDAYEKRVLAHLELWWSNGVSYDRMAQRLNNKNIFTKRNRIWRGSTISRILARERGS